MTCWTDPQDGRKEVLPFRVFLFFSTCFKNSLYKEKFIHDVNIMAFFFHIGSKKKATFNLHFTPMERVVSNTIPTIGCA